MNHMFETESDQSACGGAGTGNHMEKASGEVVHYSPSSCQWHWSIKAREVVREGEKESTV